MWSPVESKLTGLNAWFIIEILAFYGYIFAAVIYTLERSIRSTMGWFKKTKQYQDQYKYDFMAFNRKDLDWRAFVTILFQVNIGLCIIDEFVLKTENNCLRSVMI